MKIEMIDELLKDCKTSEDIFGEGGLFSITKQHGTCYSLKAPNKAPKKIAWFIRILSY